MDNNGPCFLVLNTWCGRSYYRQAFLHLNLRGSRDHSLGCTIPVSQTRVFSGQVFPSWALEKEKANLGTYLPLQAKGGMGAFPLPLPPPCHPIQSIRPWTEHWSLHPGSRADKDGCCSAACARCTKFLGRPSMLLSWPLPICQASCRGLQGCEEEGRTGVPCSGSALSSSLRSLMLWGQSNPDE